MGKRAVSPQYVAYINSKGWKQSLRRQIALNLLFGRDPIIPLLKAHDVEHLSYKRVDFPNCRGHEIPFRLIPSFGDPAVGSTSKSLSN
ncbi:hypothetical protein [Leptolyngbya sp. FACHB-711]|uniref:hypothetical protein n=1 Tax=unclassified Leptolyngbya TaxID=2650499 RepID=UPI001686F5F5|nr:hypothetical protein [Leptolyngbya sp. FACHB-711]MBD1848520.1 hypothetical protein [Cyanobacteria bacterium FACHB-502]MBD2025071.1 hypothetical protein [Leptolyngbya sp. FACHB-711]